MGKNSFWCGINYDVWLVKTFVDLCEYGTLIQRFEVLLEFLFGARQHAELE